MIEKCFSQRVLKKGEGRNASLLIRIQTTRTDTHQSLGCTASLPTAAQPPDQTQPKVRGTAPCCL